MIVYPYYLYVQEPQAEATRNDEGDFVESLPSDWFLVGKCRDEVNTKGETVPQVNGENIQLQAIVYVPKNTPILAYGSKIIVAKKEICDLNLLKDSEWLKSQFLTDLIRINDSIKGHSLTRVNMRLWV